MQSRVKISIRGAVQGVGFRPFIYRLANEMKINGSVMNNSSGVLIDCEGDREVLDLFIRRIQKEKPALSFISGFEYFFLEPNGYNCFEIIESRESNEISAFILPDISVCPDCQREMFDPADRRYLYPFINCTNCGPRFSIIKSLPYDRQNTTMSRFRMCDKCSEEYHNPNDRRYHAQPTACPDCGPHAELWDSKGKLVSTHHLSILDTCERVRKGEIVAIKGIGGFQLIADAGNKVTLFNLRNRKRRIDKPFALMFPHIDSVKDVCELSPDEELLLSSPESPIVLLKRKSTVSGGVSELVAPANPYLGVMLPYSPLHHLIMQILNIPVVATSGNLSEEPMCIDEHEALERLGGIADSFLVHNRPVLRHVDDSVVRILNRKVMLLRRARGYAPFPVEFNSFCKESETMIALGAHLKNTVALKKGNSVFISQHIGDLESYESEIAFKNIISDFKNLYKSENEIIITDKHPDYYSVKYAENLNGKVKSVQHHVAHVASCRAENHVAGPALAIVWDGTGYSEGEILGGEFFLTDDNSCIRTGSLRQFRLPGGDAAVKESRRSAFAVLYEIYGNDALRIHKEFFDKNFSENETNIILKMLENQVNSPLCSSAGRLFDAAASLLDINQKMNYEAQAAMLLEFACKERVKDFYNFSIKGNDFFIIDWENIIVEMLEDMKNKIPIGVMAAKFHNTLTHVILKTAMIAGEKKVVLSGGCFQNSYLLTHSIALLEENGFSVYTHQRIPANDGGISLGQIVAANWNVSSRKDILSI